MCHVATTQGGEKSTKPAILQAKEDLWTSQILISVAEENLYGISICIFLTYGNAFVNSGIKPWNKMYL